MLSADSVDNAYLKIINLLLQVECPTLEEIVAKDNLLAVVESANIQRLSNNPRRVSREQLIEVLSLGMKQPKQL